MNWWISKQEVDSLRRDKARLLVELQELHSTIRGHQAAHHAMERLFEQTVAAKDAVIDVLTAQTKAAVTREDASMARVEKVVDYMTRVSTGHNVFAPDPVATEEEEQPEEKIKSDVERLMHTPVDGSLLEQAIAAHGRRPRAVQQFIQKRLDEQAKDRVAAQFDSDRTEVEAEVNRTVAAEPVTAAA